MRYLIAAAALGLSLPAQAATTVYTEDFDSYPASQVPWNGSGVWSTGGSVDLVRSGEFNLTCVSGNCVDLTGDRAGSLSRIIDLAAGLYSLTFQFTGNQLDGIGGQPNIRPPASFEVSFNGVTSTVGPLANNSTAFQTFSATYNVLNDGPVTLSFTQLPGGDQFRGSIIDSIAIAAVPEPTTWALMILGFGMVGSALRRRRGKVTTGVSFA